MMSSAQISHLLNLTTYFETALFRLLTWTTFLLIFSHPHLNFGENISRWCRLLKSGVEGEVKQAQEPKHWTGSQISQNITMTFTLSRTKGGTPLDLNVAKTSLEQENHDIMSSTSNHRAQKDYLNSIWTPKDNTDEKGMTDLIRVLMTLGSVMT
jgi:hypothetical protein